MVTGGVRHAMCNAGQIKWVVGVFYVCSQWDYHTHSWDSENSQIQRGRAQLSIIPPISTSVVRSLPGPHVVQKVSHEKEQNRNEITRMTHICTFPVHPRPLCRMSLGTQWEVECRFC